GGDMLTQRLSGLLPVLMHDGPSDVCIIGLGSGVTLESALGAGIVARADVVEISPEVVEASAFFERENANALGAGNVRLIIGDGRSHLLLTTRQYDVIVSEPSNPWMAGVAALFTREFFEAARGIYGRSATDNTIAIRALADPASLPLAVRRVVETATSVSWTARGLMELKAEAYTFAYDDLRRAVTMRNGNAAGLEAALRGLSEAAAGAGRQDEERIWLQSLAAQQPADAAVRVELSRVLASNGDLAAAAATATEAMRLAPDDPLPGEQLASVL